MRRLALLLLFLCTMALTIVPPVRADQGWVIERFHAEIQVEPDTSLRITESLDVDFNSLEKHGIFREIPVVYDYNQTHNRIYKLTVERVTNAGGSAWPYTVERNGANEQIRIGDPDRTVSGKQTYRITYRVRGALNAFDDHDELFWNVNGRDWDVPFREVSASVLLAGGGLASATCFQGTLGSLQPCDLAAGTERIEYRATAPLAAGEELTLVAAVRKGVLPAPELFLEQRPRTFPEYFEVSPGTIGATLRSCSSAVWRCWRGRGGRPAATGAIRRSFISRQTRRRRRARSSRASRWWWSTSRRRACTPRRWAS